MRTFVLGAAAIAALSLMAIAPAHADWRWRHGSRGWVRFWAAPGVVVAGPPVVYAAPPPVYYAPPPVYYAPPPVVYGPPVVAFGVHIR